MHCRTETADRRKGDRRRIGKEAVTMEAGKEKGKNHFFAAFALFLCAFA
jgi:hypothetical protein